MASARFYPSAFANHRRFTLPTPKVHSIFDYSEIFDEIFIKKAYEEQNVGWKRQRQPTRTLLDVLVLSIRIWWTGQVKQNPRKHNLFH